MASRTSRCGVSGFSLTEVLVAMGVTVVSGLMAFEAFLAHDRVFEDQHQILEMQQRVRAVTSLMADQIRTAGEGVPVYAARLQGALSEEVAVFLEGTGADAIVFRSGRGLPAARLKEPPGEYTMDETIDLRVDDAAAISERVGANTDHYLYLWGPTDLSWNWIRARILNVDRRADTVTVTPEQSALASATFRDRPHLDLEGAVAFRLRNGTIQIASARGFTDPAVPELVFEGLGNGFTALRFRYFDADGVEVTPSNLNERSRIRKVHFQVSARTEGAMNADGIEPEYSLSSTIYPHNLGIAAIR